MTRGEASYYPGRPIKKRDIDLDASRNPLELLNASAGFLDSVRRFFVDNPNWRETLAEQSHSRIALHQNIQAAQATIARLRLVLVVLPPFDSESDWAGVEHAARKLDGRLGGVDV